MKTNATVIRVFLIEKNVAVETYPERVGRTTATFIL